MFRAVLAAAAAGTLMQQPAAALPLWDARHVEVVTRAREVIALSQGFWQARRDGDLAAALAAKPAIAERMEALISYMLAEFDAPLDPGMLDAYFHGRAAPLDDLSEEGLARLADGAIPIAVVKALVQAPHRVMFNGKTVPSFRAFVARYRGAFDIGGQPSRPLPLAA